MGFHICPIPPENLACPPILPLTFLLSAIVQFHTGGRENHIREFAPLFQDAKQFLPRPHLIVVNWNGMISAFHSTAVSISTALRTCSSYIYSPFRMPMVFFYFLTVFVYVNRSERDILTPTATSHLFSALIQ